MTLTMGKYSLIYRCPLYFRENRLPDTKSCATFLSLNEKDTILNQLYTFMEKEDLYEGYQDSTETIEYEIGRILPEYTEIKINKVKRGKPWKLK